MFAKSTLLFCVIISAVVCGPTNRIIGGDEIAIERAPWQVSMEHNGRSFCGGSIIAERWVITAAHCVEFSSRSNAYTIRAGTSIAGLSGRKFQIKRIIIHEQYDRFTLDYDYSLIELAEAIDFNETMQPIALANTDDDFADGTLCKTTGWGATQNLNESSKILRGVMVPIFNQGKCHEANKIMVPVTSRMICAGYQYGRKDACQGDSGGPLVCNNKLAGITSWGNGCALENHPGVYSRVSNQRQWIKETTGI